MKRKIEDKFDKKLKVKSHDKVLVITGKYKGKTGEVQKVDRVKDRVFVSGVNLVTRHSKKEQPKNKLASIHISNVSHFVTVDGKIVPSKVQRITTDGVKKRVLVKTGEVIEEYNFSKSDKTSSFPKEEVINETVVDAEKREEQ